MIIAMSSAEIILRLFAAAILVAYLVAKHCQRMRKQFLPHDPAWWTGHGFDAAKVLPAIERVRRDYLAVKHSSSNEIFRRRSLLTFVRRTIGRLGYFRDRNAEQENQT